MHPAAACFRQTTLQRCFFFYLFFFFRSHATARFLRTALSASASSAKNASGATPRRACFRRTAFQRCFFFCLLFFKSHANSASFTRLIARFLGLFSAWPRLRRLFDYDCAAAAGFAAFDCSNGLNRDFGACPVADLPFRRCRRRRRFH
jgi:hypothetical protein